MSIEFGENLKRIRMDRNLKQSELAEAIHVKQVTISSWERGRTEPSMGDIETLSKALNCTQDKLIGIKRDKGNITFEDVLIKVNALDIEQLKELDHIVKDRIDFIIEYQKLEQEKEEMMKRLQLYEERMRRLTERTPV